MLRCALQGQHGRKQGCALEKLALHAQAFGQDIISSLLCVARMAGCRPAQGRQRTARFLQMQLAGAQMLLMWSMSVQLPYLSTDGIHRYAAPQRAAGNEHLLAAEALHKAAV